MNQRLLPAVKGFRVHRRDVYPTHWPVQVKLATEKLERQHRVLRKTRSVADAISQAIEEKVEAAEGKEKAATRSREMDELHDMMDKQLQSTPPRTAPSWRIPGKRWPTRQATAESASGTRQRSQLLQQ